VKAVSIGFIKFSLSTKYYFQQFLNRIVLTLYIHIIIRLFEIIAISWNFIERN